MADLRVTADLSPCNAKHAVLSAGWYWQAGAGAPSHTFRTRPGELSPRESGHLRVREAGGGARWPTRCAPAVWFTTDCAFVFEWTRSFCPTVLSLLGRFSNVPIRWPSWP